MRAEDRDVGSAGRGAGGALRDARLARRLLLKLGYEFGPLLVFFIFYQSSGLWAATAAFMLAAVVSVAVSTLRQRQWPILPLISAGLIIALGALTLALQAETFIKIRPTVINGLSALLIVAGRASGHDLVRRVLSPELKLSERGWLALNLRTAAFLLSLAVLNEIVRLNFATDVWVAFKVFAIIPLDIAFALAQIPLIRRHRVVARS